MKSERLVNVWLAVTDWVAEDGFASPRYRRWRWLYDFALRRAANATDWGES